MERQVFLSLKCLLTFFLVTFNVNIFFIFFFFNFNFQNATRLTSNAFQRWMCLVTMTVLFWSAIRIVYWLSHSPSLYGVLSLILPLSILPLLASAYAEVNYQGIQVFQVSIFVSNYVSVVYFACVQFIRPKYAVAMIILISEHF